MKINFKDIQKFISYGEAFVMEAYLEAVFTHMRGEVNEKVLCVIPFVMQCSRRHLKLSLGMSSALSL